MAAHPFLSDAWIEAAREVRESFADRLPAPVADVSVNLIVTDGPDGSSVEAHLATHSGALDVELGHVGAPDATITVDHETARVLLVSRDPAAAMQVQQAGLWRRAFGPVDADRHFVRPDRNFTLEIGRAHV